MRAVVYKCTIMLIYSYVKCIVYLPTTVANIIVQSWEKSMCVINTW